MVRLQGRTVVYGWGATLRDEPPARSFYVIADSDVSLHEGKECDILKNRLFEYIKVVLIWQGGVGNQVQEDTRVAISALRGLF